MRARLQGRVRLRVVSGCGSYQVAGRIVSGCGSWQVAGRIRCVVAGCGSYQVRVVQMQVGSGCGSYQVAGRVRWRVVSGCGSVGHVTGRFRMRERARSYQMEGGQVCGSCPGDRSKVGQDGRKPGVLIGLRERAENRAWRGRMRFVRME
jgi:ribosomal protein L32